MVFLSNNKRTPTFWVWSIFGLFAILVGASIYLGARVQDSSTEVTVVEDDRVSISIGEETLYVEISETPQERAMGLMYRTELNADAGMLFVWPDDTTSSFWMVNTFIPLSIAFVDASGEILQIEQRTDIRSDTQTVPDEPFRYAIEVNIGWFVEQGIEVGDIVNIPEIL